MFSCSFPPFFFLKGKIFHCKQVKSYKVFTPAQRTDGSLSLWATWAGKDAKSLANISKYLPGSAVCASLGKNNSARQRCSQKNSSGRWFIGQEGPLRTGWPLTAHTQSTCLCFQEQSTIPGALQGGSEPYLPFSPSCIFICLVCKSLEPRLSN